MNPDPEASDDERELDDPALAAVAEAILEGGPIDWSTAASSDSTDPSLTRQLRVLADIAALHRTLLVGEPEIASDEASESAARPTWGHLQLLEKVGQGAFGEVFRAWDPHLSREVALKLLGPSGPLRGADSPSWVLEEARFLAAIRHPNVVTVHGADRLNGRVGFWTEFIHGRTLAELVHEQGPFTATDAAAIGIDVCRAISAVHRAGLLHRDIKANNVMREAGGRIVLLDFGATKDFAQHAVADAVIGDPNGPTGTPLYVAPELWRDSAATPQSDIYSLGVLLYFLVTGSYPVRGATVRDVGDAHRAGARVSLRDERPDLPGAFIGVVERAIDPDPSKRFGSIAAFESALSQTRVRVRGAVGQRVPIWKQRSAVIAAVVCLALAGAASVIWRQRGVVSERPALERVRLPDFSWMGHPSNDGRFLPYVDRQDNVQVLEIATGRSQMIRQKSAPAESGVTWLDLPDGSRSMAYSWSLAAMSPHGDRVAYTWRVSDGVYELWLASTDGKWGHTLLERRSAYEPVPVAWSPDGLEVLCWLNQKNGTSDLVLVPTEGGARRLLFSEAGGVPATALSPDGRFVALERSARPDHPELVITAITGAAPQALFPTVGDESSPAWVDATHLLFLRPSPDIPRSRDAWIVPVINGKVDGEPTKVFTNLGAVPTLMTVPDQGLMYQTVRDQSHEVYVQSVDLGRATTLGAQTRISRTEIGNHASPSWSPDGKWIAYFTMRPPLIPQTPKLATLTIQDVSSGRTHEPQPSLSFQGSYTPQWLPNSKAVIVWGKDEDRNDRWGYYQVDIDTGETSVVKIVGANTGARSQVAPDGTSLLYLDERGIVAHRFVDAVETVVIASSARPGMNDFGVSRDGRLAFAATSGGLEQKKDALVVQTRDGSLQTLLEVHRPEFLLFQAWTPDGNNVLFSRGTKTPAEVWMLPASGSGEARDMHVALPVQPNPLSVSPDGLRIAYPERIQSIELWIRPLPLMKR